MSKYSLKTRNGDELPILSAAMRGKVAGTLFELEVEQRFRNNKNRNVEVVYTFPLPATATLLELEIELNDEKLIATAAPRRKAERAYEKALSDGNSAILLEQSGNGLCTLNLGNLMRRKMAVVRYRIVEPLLWQQGQLRIVIPTTIAPRYGNPVASGLQPQQVPKTNALVEYPLSIRIDVMGKMAAKEIVCPSHSVAEKTIPDGRRFELGQAYLDRDFILTLDGMPASFAYQAVHAGKQYVWAGLLPRMPDIKTDRPISLRLVLDCSGSMAGDSIVQSQAGSLQVLDSLGEGDEFNITRFGGGHEHYFPALQAATKARLKLARQLLGKLWADMGGTETNKALRAVMALNGEHDTSDILLVTDGEFWGSEEIITDLCNSGLRLFIIGVGSAPNHADLQQLAETTGGSYTAVSPNEDVGEAIVRVFRRMRMDVSVKTVVSWPAASEWAVPLSRTIFRNDMASVAACYREPGIETLSLEVTQADGTVGIEPITVEPWPGEALMLARLAVAEHLRKLPLKQAINNQAAEALAVEFNLLSPYTHLFVVQERTARSKAKDFPVMETLDQMLAAGYGGLSSVGDIAKSVTVRHSPRRRVDTGDLYCMSLRQMDTPPFLRRQVDRVDLSGISRCMSLPTTRQTAKYDHLSGSASGSSEIRTVNQLVLWIIKTCAKLENGTDIHEIDPLSIIASMPDAVMVELVIEEPEDALIWILAAFLQSDHADRLSRFEERSLRGLLKTRSYTPVADDLSDLVNWMNQLEEAQTATVTE